MREDDSCWLSFASFPEQNSRATLADANLGRTGKRPALANVRVLNFLCKKIFQRAREFVGGEQEKNAVKISGEAIT